MCFSNIDIKKNKERCLELLRSTGREGMEDMIIELEKMGYFVSYGMAERPAGQINSDKMLMEAEKKMREAKAAFYSNPEHSRRARMPEGNGTEQEI